MSLQSLPIFNQLDTICNSLKTSSSHFLVLTAETAAGKSTGVPCALLKAFSKKIYVLEPRKLSVFGVANRISELLGEKIGESIGYRVHLEKKVSEKNRLEVMTEGMLLPLLQKDPSLSGVDVVVLDEFHERSVNGDLLLSFLKEAVTLRDDLFILVMSATMDTEKVSSFLKCPVLTVPGRQYPVEVIHPTELINSSENQNWSIGFFCKEAIIKVLYSEKGDILVFLPGIADIRLCEKLLREWLEQKAFDIEIIILHSTIPFSQQKKVYDITSEKRRVILSSAIAETSITVPRITTVIDSGFSRINRYNQTTGMNALSTEIESVFSSEQRKGRAGRLGPGLCYRLWNPANVRIEKMPAEILRSDLVPLVLECALWGVKKITDLEWLDTPSCGGWNQAVELLSNLGCLEKGSITSFGKEVLSLGIHPRLGVVALKGGVEYAIKYALGEKEKDSKRLQFEQDINRRLSFCKVEKNPGWYALLQGYPDRLAYKIESQIYQFPSGKKGKLLDPTLDDKWIIAPLVQLGDGLGIIQSFERIPSDPSSQELFFTWLQIHKSVKSEVTFAEIKSKEKRIQKHQIECFGKIVLSKTGVEVDESVIGASGLSLAAEAWCSTIENKGFFAPNLLPWTKNTESLFKRAEFYFYHKLHQNIEIALMENLSEWFAPFVPLNGNITEKIFEQSLDYAFSNYNLNTHVPQKIILQNGKARNLSYEILDTKHGPIPVLEVVIQDLFGTYSIPSILGVKVLLKLLSPARRPLQITEDLEGFWKNTWPEICKEMKGRYPKHNWDYTKITKE